MRTDTLITAVAFSLALATAVGVGAKATGGFQAFTLESARRLEALRAPRAVGHLNFTTLEGRQAGLHHYAGKWLVVDFIYTRCQTLCVSLGSVYEQLQQRLSREIAAGQVQLLSVSFDPAHDAPEQLSAYRARQSNSVVGWDMARPAAQDVATWLTHFGVVVIPDGLGGFVHNAGLHIVGPDGRLRSIVDLGDLDQVLRHVQPS